MYKYGDLNDGWGHQITYLGKGDGESAKRQLGKGIVSGQMTWCVAGEVSFPFLLLTLSLSAKYTRATHVQRTVVGRADGSS